jgi:hypothetical protein
MRRSPVGLEANRKLDDSTSGEAALFQGVLFTVPWSSEVIPRNDRGLSI